MENKDFNYQLTEVLCSDLKIIFITDEKTTVSCDSAIHMHSFWELFLIQQGTLTVATDTCSFQIEENQALLIPPNAYHSTKFSSDAVKISILFAFEKTKEKDDELLFDEFNHVFSKCGFHHFLDPYIGHLIEVFLKNYLSNKIGKKWRIKSSITDLLFYLYDYLKGESPLHHNLMMQEGSYWLYKYAIDRLLDIYYTSDISLEELSEKLFVSPQYITRIISTAYGKSFNTLKLELKMRNAKKLLKETNLTATEVGLQIGYTSFRGFLSAFQKYEGCTPSEYRKNNQIDFESQELSSSAQP